MGAWVDAAAATAQPLFVRVVALAQALMGQPPFASQQDLLRGKCPYKKVKRAGAAFDQS